MSLELEYPVNLLCEIAGVKRAAYYKFKRKPLKKTDNVENLIVELFHRSHKRAGYRTIKYSLKNKYDIIVNHKKIQRIMRENGLRSIVRKKPRIPREQPVIKENLLGRDFSSAEPGKKFVVDITYIPTKYKMFYLCAVIDLFNREPVAWKVSDSLGKQLSIDTIRQLSKRFNLAGSIIHSDQGVQFTNKEYVALLEKLKVQQSMSRKGNCWDNALAESFFSHFKCEAIYLMKNRLTDYEAVLQITDEYMDYFINERPQKYLGGLSPREYSRLKLAA